MAIQKKFKRCDDSLNAPAFDPGGAGAGPRAPIIAECCYNYRTDGNAIARFNGEELYRDDARTSRRFGKSSTEAQYRDPYK
ncbi:hypothetical protein EVAR_16986_1 [Eumeta japonica]|uniref:Uncharacterized protein n=1 Tax=Eumeta variegata TaxID=151549 RepID=A0A4C1TVL6_EUMVA|nr:hypothetical protein EVAR_16986_1 [Eumeta japonica]